MNVSKCIEFYSLRKSVIHNPLKRQLRTAVINTNFNNRKMQFQNQYRGLHAAWSILLNHTFLYAKVNSFSSLGQSLEETDLPAEDTPTILFLHDSQVDMQQTMNLARILLQQRFHTKKAETLQCLLVDIRGSGGSDGDDYDAPHTVETATEDVLTLVQSVCPSSSVPDCIVAFGILGRAMAMQYANKTSKEGGMTQNSHSEVTGSGAVPCPKYIFLLPTCNGSDNNIEAVAAPIEYVYDTDISESLAESALKYVEDHDSISTEAIVISVGQEEFLQKVFLLYE